MVLIAHSFFLQRDPKQRERQKPYPPLTTLLAAAMLRDEGHSVTLFDATFHRGPAAFEAALEPSGSSTVLLIEDNFNFLTKMCTETRREDALAMVRAAGRRGCRVAVNGPDACDNPRLYLEAGASAVLAGEGEFTAGEFVAARDLEQVAGLTLLDRGGALRRTAPRRERPDLDALPFPAWDLIDPEPYRRTWTRAHGHFSWNMAASRGCPYGCNWCAKPTFGRRYDQRSPGSVAEEMRRLKAEVRPDHIWFADDIFGLTAEWMRDFAVEVARRDAAIPFTLQSRVNLITEPVAGALRAAGASEVWLGVESGSQRILDAMDKGSHVDGARSATRNLKRAGIRAGWFLQLGYPPEDWDDIVLTRDLVRDEQPDDVGVSVAYPLPGTVFHDRLVAELGPRRNWRDTDELAMLFRGMFDTAFYRMVRDALHADVALRGNSEGAWVELAARARSTEPSTRRSAGAPDMVDLPLTRGHFPGEGGNTRLRAERSSRETRSRGAIAALVRTWLKLRYRIFSRRYGRLVLETIDGVPLLILPQVFNPVLLRSGALMARALARLPLEDATSLSVLDLGTGSGVGAVFAARRGASVVAVDINPEAVRCARINALLNHAEERIDVRLGDLFEPVQGRRFDLVLFNPPFYRGVPGDNLDHAWRGQGVFERFAASLGAVLAPGGYALLTLSTDGDCEELLAELRAAGFRNEIVEQTDLINEVVTIYAVRRRSPAA